MLTGMRRDIANLLHASDIFVFTSAGGDGLPIAILEAMAAACPVVATASDGIPEEVIHGQTGLLVRRGDPHSLAEAIALMAENQPMRWAMGRAGSLRLRSFFTVPVMVSKISKLYKAMGA